MYKWVCNSDDGTYVDNSEHDFATKAEAYNDMRNAALEKMKWNTEYNEDFDAVDEIDYHVDFVFSQGKIIHTSYSGTYTYEIRNK